MVGSRVSRRRVLLRSKAVWDRLHPLNVSQNDLADLLGISSGHLSRLINGRRSPSPPMRRRFMEALGCTDFDDLFYVVDDDA